MMRVPPPDEEMLARMPMPRDEYERLCPRSRLTVLKQKVLNMIARVMIHPGLRMWLYRQMGANIGRDCIIEMYANLDDQFPELFSMEDHSGVTRCAIILCHDDALAKTGHAESTQSGFVARHGFVAPVQLKRYSAAGIGSILLPGVTLHEGALVGAGAVVTKDVPAYSIAAGVPARVVKQMKGAPAPDAGPQPAREEVEPAIAVALGRDVGLDAGAAI